jgi:hypothetical protein
MRAASRLAGSSDPDDIRSGFEMIALIVSESDGGHGIEFGFIDNALFLARKYASSENPGVRRAVVSSIVEIGRVSGSWLEAAAETADEIYAQPSDNARQVAGEARSKLDGR